MKVRDDCPKGYKRQELVDIAKSNGIRITRVLPLKGPKNMKELCTDIKSIKRRSNRDETITKVRDECPKGYKRDELVDLAKQYSIKISRNPPLKGPKNMKELCDELKKGKSKRESIKKSKRRESIKKSIKKSKRRESIKKSNKSQSFDLDAIGFNPITLDDENVGNYLRENIGNIAIKFKNNYYLTNRKTIKKVLNSMKSVDFPTCRLDNVGKIWLFNFRKVGIPLGFVDKNAILDLLKSKKKIQTYEVSDTNIICKYNDDIYDEIEENMVVRILVPVYI